MMKRLDKKGVSLAELLAVVVIMGIIAAIAIPLVGNVIETSKKKAFLGDLVTLTEAARTYCLVEGKDTDDTSICYKFENIDGAGAKNQLEVDADTGIVTVNSSSDFNGAITSDSDKLQKYFSKTFSDVGSDILIVNDGSKYYVRVQGNTLASKQKYNTPKTANTFIDPTNENVLDQLTKATA